jgi:hypothetical protein
VTALVLVPTRELCLQVYEILQKLLHRFHWIVPGYVMGGENRSKEKARLRKGRKFALVLQPLLYGLNAMFYSVFLLKSMGVVILVILIRCVILDEGLSTWLS